MDEKKIKKVEDLTSLLFKTLAEMQADFEKYLFAVRYRTCKGQDAAHWFAQVETRKREIETIQSEAERRRI